MSTESRIHWPEPDDAGLNFKDTELTLGLPGCTSGTTEAGAKSGTKRGFSQTVDLNLGRSYVVCHGEGSDKLENDVSGVTKPQGAKAEPVGWPPVRASRKKLTKSCRFVKVAVDGVPYLRKVDLERYNSYEQLLSALEYMVSCLAIQNQLNMRDPANGVEYVPTFEDKEGDWMLVGDVPWKMFIESCKRIRLMKSSDAVGLSPTTSQTSLVCFG